MKRLCLNFAVALSMAAAILVMSGQVGCKSNLSTPAAPVALAQTMKTIADAGNAAVDGLRVAKANGTISVADFNTSEKVLGAVAVAGMQIDAEQQSADTWAVQQTKILAILQNTGLAQLKAQVSPTAYAIVVAVITAVNQLSVSLGGPTI